jgi:hypothetical protein
MESRHAGVIDELKRLRARGDDDIRVAEGAAGGATRISGYRKLSCRTLSAVAASHGFDASLCTHENNPVVTIELVNRVVHPHTPITAATTDAFAEACKAKLEAATVSIAGGGSCWMLTVSTRAQITAAALSDILATTRVVDVWAFANHIVVLFANTPKHTSALTHLREQRPELFSPGHIRSLADKRGTGFKK